MSAGTALRSTVTALFHPNHAKGQREFAVAVKREGKTSERTVWADTWFDAWSDALDENGIECRIEVKAL